MSFETPHPARNFRQRQQAERYLDWKIEKKDKPNRKLTSSERIGLGLALMRRRFPCERLTLQQMADYCDCSKERIRQIEEQALRKLRGRLRMMGRGGDIMREIGELTGGTSREAGRKVGTKDAED